MISEKVPIYDIDSIKQFRMTAFNRKFYVFCLEHMEVELCRWILMSME